MNSDQTVSRWLRLLCAAMLGLLGLQGCRSSGAENGWKSERIVSADNFEFSHPVLAGGWLYYLVGGDDSESSTNLARLRPGAKPEPVRVNPDGCETDPLVVELFPISDRQVGVVIQCDRQKRVDFRLLTVDATSGSAEPSGTFPDEPPPVALSSTGPVAVLSVAGVCGDAGGLVRVESPGGRLTCAASRAARPVAVNGTELIFPRQGGCQNDVGDMSRSAVCSSTLSGSAPVEIVPGFGEYGGMAATADWIVIAGKPASSRPGLFRVRRDKATQQRIATGTFAGTTVDSTGKKIFAVQCSDTPTSGCHSIVGFSHSS